MPINPPPRRHNSSLMYNSATDTIIIILSLHCHITTYLLQIVDLDQGANVDKTVHNFGKLPRS